MFVLMACVSPSDTGASELPQNVASLVVSPDAVDFGETDAGTAASVEVTLSNEGGENLRLFAIDSEDAELDVGFPGTVLIPTGSSTSFEVRWTPATAEALAASVSVESDDPEGPVFEIPVEGIGIAPVLEIDPAQLDFGEVLVGCDAEEGIALTNSGNTALSIEGSTFDAGGAFTLDFSEALPVELAPGASVQGTVVFAPEDEGEVEATWTLDSSDPADPTASVVAVATGVVGEEQTDVFEQGATTQIDVLFVVESVYKSEWEEGLAGNLGHLVDALGGFDYRIAVVTEDDGCVGSSVLFIDGEMSATAQAALFMEMLCPSGASTICTGSDSRAGFELAEAAHSRSQEGQCNEGLFREAAVLNVVGFAAVPDQSINPVEYYLSVFRSDKDDPDMLTVSGIGGDYPTGCEGAQAYTGFYEAALATGGELFSICAEDYGASMAGLGKNAVHKLHREAFVLSAQPVEQTLVVTVHGIPVTSFVFDPGTNAVVFDLDAIPEPTSTIQVTYALVPESCD